MRRVRYGAGISLDGFIADADGGTDFLVHDATYDFKPFFAAIDTVLMGRKTYEQAALRYGMRGGHPGARNYVFSRTLDATAYPEVTVVAHDAERTVAELRAEEGKDIWLCGGGELFRTLLSAGLVDTVELGVSPVLLGNGIPFLALGPLSELVPLELTTHKVYPSGMVVLEYVVKCASA